MRHLYRLLFLLVPSLMPLVHQAQTGDLRADTVQLLSTRMPQTITEAGRHITVIRATEIRELPVQTVDELLRYVSGVEVQARGPMGAQADLLMRGSSFGQVLVLLDGMRLNDPLTGHFNSYLPVSLAEISRIEILRGPAAALYGPDAVGGVIHVITKTFEPTQASNSSLQVQVGQGLHDLDDSQDRGLVRSLEAGGQLSLGAWQMGAGLTLNRSNGDLVPPDSLGQRNDVDVRTVSLSARFDGDKGWAGMIRAAYDERTFSAFRYYTLSPFDLSREQTRQGWVQGRLQHTGRQSQTQIDLAYKAMQDSFLFNPAFAANIHQTQFANLQLHHNQKIHPRLDLAFGGQADRRQIESTDRGDHLAWHAGLYGMAFARPLDGMALTGSLRADWDANYGLEVLPQLNASYSRGGLTVRAASGRSIRAADFTERYIGYNLPAPISPGRNLGNPDLLAERAWSHELGADWYLLPGLRLTMTGFYRQGSNLIDYVLRPGSGLPRPERAAADTALYLLAENVATVSTAGLESELAYSHYWQENQGLELRLAGIWIRSETPDGPPSKYLAGHARFQGNARLRFFWGPVSLSSTLLYKLRDAERAADLGVDLEEDYFLTNLRLAYWFPGRQVSAWLQVYNLADIQYKDLLGAYLPGRWIMLGLRYQLNR